MVVGHSVGVRSDGFVGSGAQFCTVVVDVADGCGGSVCPVADCGAHSDFGLGVWCCAHELIVETAVSHANCPFDSASGAVFYTCAVSVWPAVFAWLATAAHACGMNIRDGVVARFRLGDVIRYVPSEGDASCREGVAVVQENSFGAVVAVDSFEVSPSEGTAVVSERELHSGEVLFNLNDVHVLQPGEEFDVADVHVLPHGHGTVRQVFIADHSGHAVHRQLWRGRTAA